MVFGSVILGDMLCGPDGGLHIAGWFGGGNREPAQCGGGGPTADLEVVNSKIIGGNTDEKNNR